MQEIFTARTYEDLLDYQQRLVDLAVELPVWRYASGGGLGTPRHDVIDVTTNPHRPDRVCAAEVFRAMRLDLKELSGIFTENGTNNPTVSDYLDLGWCDHSDVLSWRKLAMLAAKTIEFFVREQPPFVFCAYPTPLAIYHPNGNVDFNYDVARRFRLIQPPKQPPAALSQIY